MPEIYKTIIPPNVQITPEQAKELAKMENHHALGRFATGNRTNSGVANTTNPGVHYFCLENNFKLPLLSRNHNLSYDVTIRLAKKTRHDYPEIHQLRHDLLRAPHIYSNFDLFREIYFIAKPEDYSLLYNAASITKSANADILVFLFQEAKDLNKQFERSGSNRNVFHTLHDELLARPDDIVEWATRQHPELAGVPFSWIYKAYGFGE